MLPARYSVNGIPEYRTIAAKTMTTKKEKRREAKKKTTHFRIHTFMCNQCVYFVDFCVFYIMLVRIQAHRVAHTKWTHKYTVRFEDAFFYVSLQFQHNVLFFHFIFSLCYIPATRIFVSKCLDVLATQSATTIMRACNVKRITHDQFNAHTMVGKRRRQRNKLKFLVA